jgi:hypothetical protein
MTIFDNEFWPITSSIGLINGTLPDVGKAFENWELSNICKYKQFLNRRQVVGSAAQLISALLPLSTILPTRYLLFSLSDHWIGFLDNGWRGSDPAGVVAALSERLETTCIRATHNANTVINGQRRHMLGATIFEVFVNSLRQRRSIACVNEGSNWVFEQSGDPFPFEDVEAYRRHQVMQRFTASMLNKYVKAFTGIELFCEQPGVNAEEHLEGILFQKTGMIPSPITYITLNEARGKAGLPPSSCLS